MGSARCALVRTRDHEAEVSLPDMPLGEHVIQDYRTLSFSLKDYPLTFLRAALTSEGVRENGALDIVGNGRRVTVAGLVLVRQRPVRPMV